jgi:hypothetical protein
MHFADEEAELSARNYRGLVARVIEIDGNV